jgi:F-type H+-transporting ATPase subunit b
MNNRYLPLLFLSVFLLALWVCSGSDAFAMQNISKGRKLWDNIMLWVNFGILVLLFLRYGKKPLMGFLAGEREKTEKTLNAVDAQVREARTKLDAEEEKLTHLDGRLQDVRKTILEVGQREKEKVLEMARRTADQMMEDAHRESEYRLAAAKKALKDEIVDLAVSIVEKKLEAGISPEENTRLLDRFLSDLNTLEKNPS